MHMLNTLAAAGVKPSDLLESALSNFAAARQGLAALAQSSSQSQLLTEDKVSQPCDAVTCVAAVSCSSVRSDTFGCFCCMLERVLLWQYLRAYM